MKKSKIPKQPEKCPQCDGPLNEGYGMAGGGVGPYLYCTVHGVVFKTQELEKK